MTAAARARDAGFRWLELHLAHGYLAQSFFSKHSNRRTDDYGGGFENRIRFAIETVRAVREVWPENLPLTARLVAMIGEIEAGDAEAVILKHQVSPFWKTILDAELEKHGVTELYLAGVRGGMIDQKRCPCGTGLIPLRGPHMRGCWALDLILGKE